MAGYKSFKEILIGHLGMENTVKDSKAWGAMYVCVMWVVVALRREQAYSNELRRPQTGGRYVLSGGD